MKESGWYEINLQSFFNTSISLEATLLNNKRQQVVTKYFGGLVWFGLGFLLIFFFYIFKIFIAPKTLMNLS